MRRLASIALVALLLGPLACARSSPRPPTIPAAARTPEDCDRLFGERLNAGDVDGLVALYEPGATLVREDGSAATGTAAIRAELTGFLALRPRIAMHVVRVVTGGGDVAVLHNDWQATGADAEGRAVAFAGGASEIVRRQRDGSWRFVIDDPYARGTGGGPSASSRRR
jgi:uncharacterized protein (TIGR02246 family)